MGLFSKLFGGAKDVSAEAVDTVENDASGAADMATDAAGAAVDTAGNVAEGVADMSPDTGSFVADKVLDATEVAVDAGTAVAGEAEEMTTTVVDEISDVVDGDPDTKLKEA
jgi:hypothetical protein